MTECTAHIQPRRKVFPITLGFVFRISVIYGILQSFGCGQEAAELSPSIVVNRSFRIKNNFSQRIGHPFHTQVHVEILAGIIAGIIFVFQRITTAENVLCVRFRKSVVVGKPVPEIPAEFKLACKLLTEIKTCIPGCGDPALSAKKHPSASATSASKHRRCQIGKSGVVSIVETTQNGILVLVLHVIDHCIPFVSVFCTIPHKSVSKQAFFHSWFYHQIDDGFFFTVIKSGHLRQIGPPIKYLQLFNHLGGQVLRGHFRVGAEKLFTIYHDFFYFSAVNGYLPFRIYFNARHLFQQIFQNSTFGHFV
ncbi:hypothetical protein DSECCO2_581960 [anaerobic digester metagenome]